jgi:hypothetical protein
MVRKLWVSVQETMSHIACWSAARFDVQAITDPVTSVGGSVEYFHEFSRGGPAVYLSLIVPDSHRAEIEARLSALEDVAIHPLDPN